MTEPAPSADRAVRYTSQAVATYYDTLGIAPTASADEIKRAFRREIARYHPDKVQHLGQEFQEIAADKAAGLTQAYKTLSDASARVDYDAQLKTGVVPRSDPGRSEPASQTLRYDAICCSSSSTARRKPSSVSFRSVMSRIAPWNLTGRPLSSLTTCAWSLSQWMLPSGHLTRNSVSYGPSCSRVSMTSSSTRSTSSSCTQSRLGV